MKTVITKILPPVSKSYQITFDDSNNWATVDLQKINNEKVFNNSIINTIIACYQAFPNHNLKGITFEYSPTQTEQFEMLSRQFNLFQLEFEPKLISNNSFIIEKKWVDKINNGLNTDIKKWESFLKEYEGILYYKTVTENKIQIRYFGYQIGKFDPTKTPDINNIELKNNNDNVTTFNAHYNKIKSKRSMPGDNEKSEHYLESILLYKIQKGNFEIDNNLINKLFSNNFNFQFPTLWKLGNAKQSGNSPKYIDIFAKHENRPVIMELKVHKNTGNSRGEYVFQAYGQLLNYFIYLHNIFTNPTIIWSNHLQNVKNLDWDKPLLYIVVDDFGKDKIADNFREYIKTLKKYFTSTFEIKFVEIESDFKNELKIKNVF